MQEDIPKEIKVNSITEAEKEIYRLINQGMPQNEITKINFFISGISRHFNPSQISKIKKKLETIEITDESKDYLTAELFVDFKKGKSVSDIIIEKGYKVDIVEKTYEKYIRLEKMELVPKWFMDNLRYSCYKLECHYVPENPTPKEKISCEDMNVYLNDCVDISIMA